MPPTPPARQTSLQDLWDSQSRGRNEVNVESLREYQRRAILRRQREIELPEVEITEHTESAENRALRRSPTPPVSRADLPVPMHTIVLEPGEPMRILHSPEPMQRPVHMQSSSREGSSERRNTLPTPPLDPSGPDEDSLFVPDSEMSTANRPSIRRAHPLTNVMSAWPTRSTSPINGLGDRDRSPTPGDGWEIMRTTITPDESLPSAESSFASTAASRSFNASSHGTQITEPEIDDSDDSSIDIPADDMCTEEDAATTEVFAEDIYLHEIRTYEGRERIAHHQYATLVEGNRFAWAHEHPRVEVGFRLIEEALETEEGRQRVLALRDDSSIDLERFRNMLRATRRMRARLPSSLRRRDRQGSRPAPSAVIGHYSQEARDAVTEASGQIRDYVRRVAPEGVADSPTSPPPRHSPRAPDGPVPDENAVISTDGPEAHPVSPPSNRSEREVSEALLSGDVQDLDSMRRIVERLAQRDDVPEEWWMSMGLNLSRTRPRERRNRSPQSPNARRAADGTALAGRIETSARGSARL